MMAMVEPSAGAFTSAAVPVMLPAPGRFSITSGWPSALESDGPTARVTASMPAPGDEVTMMRSGFPDCAAAHAAANANSKPQMRVVTGMRTSPRSMLRQRTEKRREQRLGRAAQVRVIAQLSQHEFDEAPHPGR